MNDNETMNLDDFLDEQQDAQAHPAVREAVRRRVNVPVIVLFSCILVVGVVVLGLQIFGGSGEESGDQTQQDSSYDQQGDSPYSQYFGTPGEGGEPGNATLSRRDEDGKTWYSTDGGQTWVEMPSDGADGNELKTKNENGKSYYSTDGGQTWKEMPSGSS